MHMEEGGNAIPYWDEDPLIRTEWEATLHREGGKSRMDDAFYRWPAPADARST